MNAAAGSPVGEGVGERAARDTRASMSVVWPPKAAYRADCFGGAATIDDHIF